VDDEWITVVPSHLADAPSSTSITSVTTAQDTHGNSVDQTITRAFGLK
jgi:hypothetical protein